MNTEQNPRRYLSKAQLAQRWGVCVLSVHRKIKEGKIRGVLRLSKRSVRIPLAEVERIEAEGVN